LYLQPEKKKFQGCTYNLTYKLWQKQNTDSGSHGGRSCDLSRRFAQAARRRRGNQHRREAQNGNECIKLLAKLKPDILLLDLRMPEKDGLAVLEEVNFDQLPTRVIVLTR